jgi:hypothetical protein
MGNYSRLSIWFAGTISAAFLFFWAPQVEAVFVPQINLPIICSFSGPENSPDLLRLTDFLVTGPSSPKVGDSITVSFKLQNYGQYDLNLGQKGVFVAARNPDNSDVSFGFTRQNTTFKLEETISVSATKVLDKAGTWKVWPSYHLSLATGEKFGPNEWHVCTIQVSPTIKDSDQDGIPDDQDNCPSKYNPQQEDIDGNGIGDVCDACDDRDFDHDGIKNCLDKCPDKPETYNQYQDDDGCPDEKPAEVKDSDGDGILDDKDKCPKEPETFNGYQDEDGCPDEKPKEEIKDTDQDGIPDVKDKCPKEKETFNNYQDEDGCPDQIPEKPEEKVQNCPAETVCLDKETAYAKGFEFYFDQGGMPVICEKISADVFKYCFKEKPKIKITPLFFPNRDINKDDKVDDKDAQIILAHYGGNPGSSHAPYDVNDDGTVDYKDLAIVGASFGKTITDEKLKNAGIENGKQLLERVKGINDFTNLSKVAGIDIEKLIRALLKAEMEERIGISDDQYELLNSLNLSLLERLQKLKDDDQSIKMIAKSLRIHWIASGGKEQKKPLPDEKEIKEWIRKSKNITPRFRFDETGFVFPDGSKIDWRDDREAEQNLKLGKPIFASVFSDFGSRVFGKNFPGMSAEQPETTATPARPLQVCSKITGLILGFPYDINTLKIRAERIEKHLVTNPITKQVSTIETPVEGYLITIQKRTVLGETLTATRQEIFYDTSCLNPGTWKLTPIFYAPAPETPIWRGRWDQISKTVNLLEGGEVSADFRFFPLETDPPTVTIERNPLFVFTTSLVNFSIVARDDSGIQKVQVFEWGRRPDGTESEPELIENFFKSDSPFPADKSYRLNRGPYENFKEVHIEVGVWDYAGNYSVKTQAFRIDQLNIPTLKISQISLPRYYIGIITEAVSSKDSDGPEALNTGELHFSFNAELLNNEKQLYKEFKQDYPYFKHFEADAAHGSPVVMPWLPVLAVSHGELQQISGYNLTAHVHESDSDWEMLIRILLWPFETLVEVVKSIANCVGSIVAGSPEFSSCWNTLCESLSQNSLIFNTNALGKALAGDVDDYIGSAGFVTTKEASFGISQNPAADFYLLEGSSEPSDLSLTAKVLGVAEEIEELGCHEVKEAIEIGEAAEKGISFLQETTKRIERGENWIDVVYHPEFFDAQPISEVKVKFVGGYVINDRDGSLRGAGDVFGRTFVGAIGGQAANINDYSLTGEDLAILPYSAADIHEFDVGGVDSGSSFSEDRFIFERAFSDPNLALLYIQIALWDDDGGGGWDNEIGTLSISWPMSQLLDMIKNPGEATKYGGGIIVTTSPDGYYVIQDTREVWTRTYWKNYFSGKELWGYPGSRITYEIWLKVSQ